MVRPLECFGSITFPSYKKENDTNSFPTHLIFKSLESILGPINSIVDLKLSCMEISRTLGLR
jgi:hypothetical protein